MNVLFFQTCLSQPLAKQPLKALANKIYREERIDPACQTHVIFCSDHVIRRLNRDFRGKDKTTDVLSFPIGDPDLLGEIYISLPRAAVQSRRYGLSYNKELQRLLVHGIFHLLGLDHHTAADQERMRQKESRYCSVYTDKDYIIE